MKEATTTKDPICGMSVEPSSAIHADRAVMIGKPDFLRSEKVTDESRKSSVVQLQEKRKTAIFVAVDGQVAGMLAVADLIKAATSEAIDALHALGLKVAHISSVSVISNALRLRRVSL